MGAPVFIKPMQGPPMWVGQKHSEGCFVAAVAMILRISYDSALRLLHPKNDVGARPQRYIKRMQELGYVMIKVPWPFRVAELTKPTLLLIAWDTCPSLGHSLVWDPKSKTALDPIDKSMSIYNVERQLFAAYQIEAP